MKPSLESLTHSLLEAAERAGAGAADAIAVDGTSLAIDVRAGALEQAERAEGIEIGLRVMLGHRQACVSASDISSGTFALMAERAVAMAREAPEDPGVGLADPSQLAHAPDSAALDLADPAAEPAPDELERQAREAEAATMACDGISQVESSGASYSRQRIHLATSGGFSAGYSRTGSGLFTVAIARSGTGMERDYFGESRVYRADLPTPEEIGRIAAERTLARRGARRPKTGAYPVLFDERIAGSLIGHLLAAINGGAIVRGASWLRDALGTRVLPAALSLTEEPLRPRTPASRAFDAEGLPTTRREIVRDGVLQGWVLDLSTGRKLGLDSTANAVRGTSAPPSPGVSNLSLTQGGQTRDELLREMGTGLLVTSMIGSTINPTTGDYSRGAAGFWVENGTIAWPVNECTIAGNLRDMLGTLVPANDARPHLSRVIPSLLVEGMTLAGE
ncbi:TldD/PmbA family protein [Tropicimonas sp.]|uniref:TldD/PmbA family protein n=1 Tax=Tropicimonas sp. TaxID=2067044 RepID=UPI003A864346